MAAGGGAPGIGEGSEADGTIGDDHGSIAITALALMVFRMARPTDFFELWYHTSRVSKVVSIKTKDLKEKMTK